MAKTRGDDLHFIRCLGERHAGFQQRHHGEITHATRLPHVLLRVHLGRELPRRQPQFSLVGILEARRSNANDSVVLIVERDRFADQRRV